MTTAAPSGTFHSSSSFPSIRPTMLTSEAARISSPSEAGVGPKKMHKAVPGGQ